MADLSRSIDEFAAGLIVEAAAPGEAFGDKVRLLAALVRLRGKTAANASVDAAPGLAYFRAGGADVGSPSPEDGSGGRRPRGNGRDKAAA